MDEKKAAPLRQVLRRVLRAILDWGEANAGSAP